MDSLTAGTALILVQCCVALVMIGFHFAAPDEKCTRDWALSASCIALGVFAAIVSHRISHPFLLLAGGCIIMAGMAYQWQGILAFYGRPPRQAGWIICLLFTALLAAMLLLDLPARQRTLLFSGTLVLLLALSLQAIWQGQGMPRTFVQLLVPAAIVLLLSSHLLKLAIAIMQFHDVVPAQRTPLDITVAYLMPIVGTVLFSIGLPLLYFERLVETNRHLATHDELSKLLNRRAICAAGERELELAQRLHRPLSIAFIDIDLFKHFNDEFGHAAGDAVIAEVSAILQRTCRTIDLVGRYGGEEFLIVLPGADAGDAIDIGRRLVETVRDYRYRGRHPVTISTGLATLAADISSWPQLLARADAMLYEAKRQGRNRYCA
ncbi:MAG TPA: GGDEF domain-containing protein [Oxalicibacterium sp.]|nr:GGDEF domain-containing protein [Oxalicibacterium sp.]